MVSGQDVEELENFLENWKDCAAKGAFIGLKELLFSLEETSIGFKPREGISYSLRAKHGNQKDRELFVMRRATITHFKNKVKKCFINCSIRT